MLKYSKCTIIKDKKYKCCGKYLFTGKSLEKRHCGFTQKKTQSPKIKGILTKYIPVCNECRNIKFNHANSKHIIYDKKYKCCGKYLFIGKISKKKYYCGFTHFKHTKNNICLTKHMLICRNCYNCYKKYDRFITNLVNSCSKKYIKKIFNIPVIECSKKSWQTNKSGNITRNRLFTKNNPSLDDLLIISKIGKNI